MTRMFFFLAYCSSISSRLAQLHVFEVGSCVFLSWLIFRLLSLCFFSISWIRSLIGDHSKSLKVMEASISPTLFSSTSMSSLLDWMFL